MTDGRDRRSVLRAGVALCSVGLAGCVNGGGGDGSSNGTNESGPDDPEPPDPEPVTSWPMQQYDAGNTAAVPNAAAPEEGVEELWRLDLGERVRSSPVVADGMVYVRDRVGTVHAVDETGDDQWTASVPEGELMTTPAIYEDLLLVPHDTGVIAFDREEGDEEWEYDSEAGTTDLTVADDAVFFADTRSGVHAVEAGTGEERWTYRLNPSRGFYAHPPAVDDGIVYVPTAASGQVDSWEISTFPVESNDKGSFFESEMYGFSAGVSITEDCITAPTPNGVHAYDMEGRELWHSPTDQPLESGVAVTDEMVYAISTADFTGTLHAIDAEDGAEKWFVDVETIFDHGPIIAGDLLVYANSSLEINSYDLATGDGVWSVDTPLTLFEWGAFAEETFYFADLDGLLLAYGDAET